MSKPASAVKKSAPRPRRRDAAATIDHILDTAADLLARVGFTGFGVNALAVGAGVDKQLIYYYFDGIEGVLRQLGSRLELWLGAPLQPMAGESYEDATLRLLREYFAALRRNLLVQRLLAWELVEPSPVLKELEAARSQAMGKWVLQLRQTLGPIPAGIDAPAINALLLAGIHYLTLRESSVGTFVGMDVQSPEGAARIEAALELIIARVYASATPAASGSRPRSASQRASSKAGISSGATGRAKK